MRCAGRRVDVDTDLVKVAAEAILAELRRQSFGRSYPRSYGKSAAIVSVSTALPPELFTDEGILLTRPRQ